MNLRNGLLALCMLAAAGCAREGADAPGVATAPLGAQGGAGTPAPAIAPVAAPVRFAKLPDRGELVAYPGRVKRVDGAYTLYRADLSEEHALRAIADGHLRLTTPEGQLLDVRYDRHVEHPSGDWTWIGHLPGDPSAQTIITFGDKAIFGSIAQAGGGYPLRLTMRDGQTWLVETDPRKVAGIVNAATRPTKPDYHIVPRAALPSAGSPRPAAGPVTAAASVSAAASTAYTIDLLIGYTPGFVSAQGSVSAANTRLNYLVDVANAALANSQVSAQVRLVHTMQVNYTDLNTNDTALEQMSGYQSGTGPVTPNSAFNALRSARETYGADLVSLVRPFKDPEQDNCGIAWLLGGGKQGIQAGQGWDDLAYSVVSDGSDQGTDGNSYYCLDETLAHEMGHNEGSAHDRVTSQGGDGVLNDPDDYGAYTYSFGYKTGAGSGNFYTVMAYGDSGQTKYRVFSNPRITFCGGRACGTTTYEDNARSLGQTLPVVAGFRATASTFTDVPSGYWAYDAIETVYNLGITSGCSTSPPMFCPTSATRRDQMAVFLLRAKHGSAYQPPAATGIFADVPTNYWAAAWIEQAYHEGITGGCNTAPMQYCPNYSVPRDQMAVFLLRAEHGSSYQPPAAVGTYTDVPASYWAAAWIEQLSREGITGGCSTSPAKYCPAAVVNRDQMAVFLVRTFNL